MSAVIDLTALPKARERKRKGKAKATAQGRALIYLRVSTDGQADDGGSLVSQEQACRSLCAARGFDVADVFIDAGESGGSLARPALTAMRDAVANGAGSVVVVYALDRLSRSQRDTLVLLDEFEQAGAGLTAASQSFDTTTPTGRAMLGMLATFAELQRAEIRDRTKRALAAKRGRGEVTQRTPYGLARDGARFVRCPDRWPVVERVLRERVAGATCAAIAAGLNADGITTSQGSQWFPASVARLARNPAILSAAQAA